jgi:hypothetical protein
MDEAIRHVFTPVQEYPKRPKRTISGAISK